MINKIREFSIICRGLVATYQAKRMISKKTSIRAEEESSMEFYWFH